VETTENVGRVLVIIPTYDERENIEGIVARVRASVPDAEILIADDASPDGTGEVADRLAAEDDHVHVLHRTGKEGLGAAYVAGFGWGLERGFDVLVEMDADGSHQPEELPRLLSALEENDLVIGSRWRTGRRSARRSPAVPTPTPGCCWASPCTTRPAASAPTARRR
jgi:dolichol-phosphate mannosyltransferase